MSVQSPKDTLVRYLQDAREAMVWKLEGLSEYDVRRPLTPTGTNLIGLVKHLASVELGYFGATFGRPSGIELPWWSDDADHNDDMFATADESREWVIDLYRKAWAHAEVTFAENDLDTVGHVEHWGNEAVTLHQILVHVVAETARHAGHADVLRELLDGAAGVRAGNTNLPDDDYDWAAHHDRVERAAREAGAEPTRR